MTEPIRIETDNHHIHIVPKVQEEPKSKGNPFLTLFVGMLLIAVAVNLWGHHSPTVRVVRPAVQGSAE